jgi:transposase
MAPDSVKVGSPDGYQQIPGIGFLTASAIVASVDDARAFKSGRQMAHLGDLTLGVQCVNESLKSDPKPDVV